MLEEKVTNIIKKPIEDAGYILDSVSYEKGKENDLMVIIDKKEGYINIGDCVTVNNIINPLLDEADLIEESYILDVCSKQKGSV